MAPNGFHASEREAWERLEAPLRRLDDRLDAFAAEHGLGVQRNYHNWPHRSLYWSDELERAIEIALTTDAALAANPPGRDPGSRSPFGPELQGAEISDPVHIVRPTYSVSGVAWTELEGQHVWRSEQVLEPQPIEMLAAGLDELLPHVRELVAGWTVGDLAPREG